MNKAISWRETRLSEVLMMKLDCVCDGNHFCLGIYSSLAAIMVECSTGAETISSSIIPLFASAWIFVNNYRDPKGAKCCDIIIERSAMQVSPCLFSGISCGLEHDIECELSLFQNLIPQRIWELYTRAC